MLSELVRQHKHIDGRFEIGIQIVRRVSDFGVDRPILLKHLQGAWKLTDEKLQYVLSADTHEEAYVRLKKSANIKSKYIYDKFPGYSPILSDVLDRTKKPCLANVRDPRAIVYSRKKRADELGHSFDLEKTCEHICWYFQGIKNAMKTHDVCLVRHEELCSNPIQEGSRIYKYLGLEFKSQFVKLEGAPPDKIDQGGVSQRSLYVYKDHLTEEEQNNVLEFTKEHSEFHWHT